MDRRSFLKTSALGGSAAAATTLAAPAIAQNRRTLTMVTSVPDGFRVFDDAANICAAYITQMSDGELTVEKRPAGTLVGAFEVFDAVSAGQADMYHSAEYYFLNQHPAYTFFTSPPFGMTAQELANWYYHRGGMDLHHELSELFNIRPFLAGNTGVQAGGWFREEINSAADLQGLRFRMPGQGGQALGELGASVQNIPGGEIYQALASGTIDGAEWIGPYADEPLGFNEITNLYYVSGFHEPGSGLCLGVNLDLFNELEPRHQKIIEVAAQGAYSWSLSKSLAENGAALARLQAQGVQLRQFPDDVWDAFGPAAKTVVDAPLGDPIYDRIYESYFASMDESAAFMSQSDSFYQAQRSRVRAG